MKKINKLNIKETFIKINHQFNKKKYLLIFLLLLIGVLISSLSASHSHNLWYKFYNTLNNPLYNMLLFFTTNLNIMYLYGDIMSNYNIISRYNNFNMVIKMFNKDIIIYTVYIIFISSILAFAGAIIFSFGDIKMINHPIYNFPIIFYIIFFLLRSMIITSIISIIIFLLYIIINRLLITIITVINSSLFFLNFLNFDIVRHFYNMPLLYHAYFTPIKYDSFFLEIIVSILEVFILLIVSNFIFNIVTKKKRDFI